MPTDPTDVDDEGQWIGICLKRATSREVYPPGTLGGETRRIRAQADGVGAIHLVDQVDALMRNTDAARDDALRANGLIP